MLKSDVVLFKILLCNIENIKKKSYLTFCDNHLTTYLTSAISEIHAAIVPVCMQPNSKK